MFMIPNSVLVEPVTTLEKREYFSTLFVFSESGQPEVPLDRQFLASELKVAEDPSSKSV